MATGTITLTKETVDSLQQVAQELGVNSGDLAEQAIRQYLRQEAERKIRKEEDFYRQQHNHLLATYAGRFIALHKGQVIDHDINELALYLRIRQEYPLLGVLIKKVSPEIEEVWHMRSPRLEYDG